MALPVAWLAGLVYSLSMVVADVLATLSLAGTLVVGEYLAGALLARAPRAARLLADRER